MDLPQELLEEIISYLPLDDEQDEQSLRNCSLVARSWVGPSRRRLFETVEIREENLQLWLANIPSTNEVLLQHVRSLTYVIDDIEWSFSAGLKCANSGEIYHPDIFQDYLPSFNQLRHLRLSSIRFTSQQVNIFSAFRHTLSRLTLDHCIVTVSALVTIINYISSLDRLDIYSVVSPEDNDEPTPLSRPVPKLHIADCYCHCDLRGLLGRLSTMSPLRAGTLFPFSPSSVSFVP